MRRNLHDRIFGLAWFALLVSTLMPFLLRHLNLWRKGACYYHQLGLACLAVLTLHGYRALYGRRVLWLRFLTLGRYT